LNAFKTPLIRIQCGTLVVDNGIQSWCDDKTEGQGCQRADDRNKVQDYRHNQVQDEVQQDIAKAVPGVKEVTHPGFALAPGHFHQRTGITGDEADVGKGNPDHQHEHQGQDDQVSKVGFPAVQGGHEQFGKIVRAVGRCRTGQRSEHGTAMLTLDGTIQNLFLAVWALHDGLPPHVL